MSKKIAGFWIGSLVLLCLTAPSPVQAEEGAVLTPATADAGCFAQIFAERSSLPTCGTCQHFCASEPSCEGKYLGDKCSNDGGTCQSRTGCAIYNCCYCGNANPITPGLPGAAPSGGD